MLWRNSQHQRGVYMDRSTSFLLALLSLSLLAVLALVMLSPNASATNRYLDDNNLQGCINNCSAGDTIVVKTGTHTIASITYFNRSVDIIGNDSLAVISHAAFGMTFQGSFNITNMNFTATSNPCISINASSTVIVNSSRFYSTGATGHGMSISSSDTVMINSSQFIQSGAGTGIIVTVSNNFIAINNTSINASSSHAIYLTTTNVLLIDNSTINAPGASNVVSSLAGNLVCFNYSTGVSGGYGIVVGTSAEVHVFHSNLTSLHQCIQADGMINVHWSNLTGTGNTAGYGAILSNNCNLTATHSNITSQRNTINLGGTGPLGPGIVDISHCNITATGTTGSGLILTGVTGSQIRINSTYINGTGYGIQFIGSVSTSSIEISNNSNISSNAVAALMMISAANDGYLNITDSSFNGTTGGLTSYWHVNMSNVNITTSTGTAFATRNNLTALNCNVWAGGVAATKALDLTAGDVGTITIRKSTINCTGGQGVTMTGITNTTISWDNDTIYGGTYGIRYGSPEPNGCSQSMINTNVSSSGSAALMSVAVGAIGYLNCTNTNFIGVNNGLTSYKNLTLVNVNCTTNSGTALVCSVNLSASNCNFTSVGGPGVSMTTGDSGLFVIRNVTISSGTQALALTTITNTRIIIDNTSIVGVSYSIRSLTLVDRCSYDITNSYFNASTGVSASLQVGTGVGYANISNSHFYGSTGGITTSWIIDMSNSSSDTNTGSALSISSLVPSNIRYVYLNASATGYGFTSNGAGTFNLNHCYMARTIGADYTVGSFNNCTLWSYYANAANIMSFDNCTIGPGSSAFEGLSTIVMTHCNINASGFVNQFYFYGSCEFRLSNSTFYGNLVEASTNDPTVHTCINDSTFNGVLNIGAFQNFEMHNSTYDNIDNFANAITLPSQGYAILDNCTMNIRDGNVTSTVLPEVHFHYCTISADYGCMILWTGTVMFYHTTYIKTIGHPTSFQAALNISGDIEIVSSTIESPYRTLRIHHPATVLILDSVLTTDDISHEGLFIESDAIVTVENSTVDKITMTDGILHYYDHGLPLTFTTFNISSPAIVYTYSDITVEVRGVVGQSVSVSYTYGALIAQNITNSSGFTNLARVPIRIITSEGTFYQNSTYSMQLPSGWLFSQLNIWSLTHARYLEYTRTTGTNFTWLGYSYAFCISQNANTPILMNCVYQIGYPVVANIWFSCVAHDPDGYDLNVTVTIDNSTVLSVPKLSGDSYSLSVSLLNFTYGSHWFEFNAVNGHLYSATPVSGPFFIPNHAPAITNVLVVPSTGSVVTVFSFMVSAFDVDMNPLLMYMDINNITYPMVHAYDTLYFYNTTLPAGNSTYRCICIDSNSAIFSTAAQNITVSNDVSYTSQATTFCYVWGPSNASSFLATYPNIAWVAAYNESTSRYIYYYADGFGTDFTMTYGYSYIVGSLVPFTFTLPVLPPTATFALPYGSSFRGNPTALPVTIGDLFNSSTYLSWVGIKVGAHYEYYYRNSVDLSYLVQPLQAVFFGCSRATTITV